MSKKKKTIAIVILIFLLLFGIALMAYPYVSAVYSERVRSVIQTEYQEAVEDPAKAEEITTLRQAAIEYNHKLYSGLISPLDTEANGYFQQLKLSGSSIMCYIRIPAIDVSLPVYHGIGSEALSVGAGHMPQTSLPIGGENTHAVISAHTGMASSAMFSDIGLLEPGDLVYIDVLGETLTYQVYDSETVLPVEVDYVKIQTGKDLLTLVTCTPINVNTHRLLVHCEHVETAVEDEAASTVEAVEIKTNSLYGQQYIRNICIGFLVALVIILIIIMFLTIRRRGERKAKSQ